MSEAVKLAYNLTRAIIKAGYDERNFSYLIRILNIRQGGYKILDVAASFGYDTKPYFLVSICGNDKAKRDSKVLTDSQIEAFKKLDDILAKKLDELLFPRYYIERLDYNKVRKSFLNYLMGGGTMPPQEQWIPSTYLIHKSKNKKWLGTLFLNNFTVIPTNFESIMLLEKIGEKIFRAEKNKEVEINLTHPDLGYWLTRI
jgi:hypothetical protein